MCTDVNRQLECYVSPRGSKLDERLYRRLVKPFSCDLKLSSNKQGVYYKCYLFLILSRLILAHHRPSSTLLVLTVSFSVAKTYRRSNLNTPPPPVGVSITVCTLFSLLRLPLSGPA